jgi:GNAT superfamily N-acetyltransferase
MTAPRLVGPRVTLLPVPTEVAAAALDAADRLDDVLGGLGLRRGTGWPCETTTDALASAGEGAPCWLVVVDGEVVGECGWHGPPDDDGTLDLSYGLAPRYRRAGLGTEAVAVLVVWSERQADVRRLAADVQLGNEASRRLLRRLGFDEQPPRPPWVRAVRDTDAAPPRIRGRHVC